jgi:hypothetical protein
MKLNKTSATFVLERLKNNSTFSKAERTLSEISKTKKIQ